KWIVITNSPQSCALPCLTRMNGQNAERWCYRGSVDDWIYAGHSGKIEQLARKLTPKLGTDDFYELY
ncbi:MAG: hypothetical protein KKC71_01955, partial [Chloroflexi bacterium]|nr:hypothetical protein [Chloroflexota bacterium]